MTSCCPLVTTSYYAAGCAGKERLFLEAARVLQRKIYVSVAKRKVSGLPAVHTQQPARRPRPVMQGADRPNHGMLTQHVVVTTASHTRSAWTAWICRPSAAAGRFVLHPASPQPAAVV